MDAYSRHEVVDRLSVVAALLEGQVLGHEVVDALDDADPVKAAVLEALEAVGRAYQVAGDAYIA